MKLGIPVANSTVPVHHCVPLSSVTSESGRMYLSVRFSERSSAIVDSDIEGPVSAFPIMPRGALSRSVTPAEGQNDRRGS